MKQMWQALVGRLTRTEGLKFRRMKNLCFVWLSENSKWFLRSFSLQGPSNLEMFFFKYSKGNFVLKSFPIMGAIILPS